MKKRKRKVSESMSLRVDDIVGIFSPRRAYNRKAWRFSYDVLDNTRTRRRRTDIGGTADKHLTPQNLYRLREDCRGICRNNPIVKGLLATERDGVIGSGVQIQARTSDEGWNKKAEAAWKAEMVDVPCDVTERFNFNQFLRLYYLAYRRDGDAAVIFLDNKIQGIEGEQIGTPTMRIDRKTFYVVNGVAISKVTKRVIGYYIGSPDRWGYIKSTAFRSYRPDQVHFLFSPERFSQSRGEPALTSCIDAIDKTDKYDDAELVAATVNACFTMFVSREDDTGAPPGYTYGSSETGEDTEENRLEKMEPGTIMYGRTGEKAEGIGQRRPGNLYDTFIKRQLSKIGRPLLMPLMLITLDFSGATYMNARIAYSKVHDAWLNEQNLLVKPFVSRVWRWKLESLIRRKVLSPRDDWMSHEIVCNRWPYVDPWKESKADEQQLINGTITRTEICARQGRDFKEVTNKLDEEGKEREGKLLPQKQTKQPQTKTEGSSDAIPK